MEKNEEKRTEQPTMKPLEDKEMYCDCASARVLRCKSKKGSYYYQYELVLPDGTVKHVQPSFDDAQGLMYMMMFYGRELIK